MGSSFTFIYDGKCQFCKKFAELLELKSGLPNISIINGRDNIPLLKGLYEKGYDLDQGAILLKGEDIFHGAKAINLICSEIEDPSDGLLTTLTIVFSSSKRTTMLFPLLLIARRVLLFFRGVPRNIFS